MLILEELSVLNLSVFTRAVTNITIFGNRNYFSDS